MHPSERAVFRILGQAVTGLVLVSSSPVLSADGGTSELDRVRAAPVVALVRMKKPATADCTGIGHYHVIFEVVSARTSRRIRTAHFSYMLTEPHLTQGSFFVAGLTPERWVPSSHECLPGSMATDARVLTLVPMKDEAEGRAVFRRLRTPKK